MKEKLQNRKTLIRAVLMLAVIAAGATGLTRCGAGVGPAHKASANGMKF